MEHRRLGRSGLQVPVLSFGTATVGGGDAFFKAWGDTQTQVAYPSWHQRGFPQLGLGDVTAVGRQPG